jgi:GT2 family glycosyltransferase
MNEKPLVSIITVNFNQATVTNALLASLSRIGAPSFEVIVVDNASKDNNYTLIDTSYAFVKLVRSDVNLGFAGGNNLGLKSAQGTYLLFLNNDTEVNPDFMLPMTGLFEKDHHVGAVSPKIRYYEQSDTLQYAGFSPMNPFTLRMHAIGFKEKDTGQYDLVRETPFAHGCAMMVKQEVIEKVGSMHEEYFLYYEEHDWSTRIRKAGYRIMYQPASLVLHKESISIQKDSPLKVHYLQRNRILYMRKNIHGPAMLIPLIYLLCISIPKNILTYLVKQKKQFLSAYLKALWWHIRHPSLKNIHGPSPSF